MRNLLSQPVWEASELGHPLPDSPHACSVAMPLWDHVVGYEEQRPEVIDALKCGYPRFFLNHVVRELNEVAAGRFASGTEKTLIFPSESAAQRCRKFLEHRYQISAQVHDFGASAIFVVVFPEEGLDGALEYWRNCGELVSTRHAQDTLDGKTLDGVEAKCLIRERLSEQSGQPTENVFLFPSGMAAMFAVHRMLRHLFPNHKTAQLEFPYVDVLQIQRNFGPGVHFFSQAGEQELLELEAIMDAESLSGVLCEIPSNPLMRCIDIERVHALTQKHTTPLIVDDTIATSVNIDAFRFADVVTTSLTKYFSGTGDVMGGSVILKSDSPFYDRFREFLEVETPRELWSGDAIALEENSRDYPERVRAMNANGEQLFEYFKGRDEVDHLMFVGGDTANYYEALRRPEGKFGSLFSLVLKDSDKTSVPFYDALRISKGPSLGTNFSLVCPYTLLAHFTELDWAEDCGVSRNLIRVSVGLEAPGDLIQRFDAAFDRV